MPNPSGTAPNWAIGRTGRLYAKDEASYGTAPTLAATDALRHLSWLPKFNPQGPVPSPERRTHPSQVTNFKRRRQASFDLKGLMYPSGTLNTLPELGAILQNVMSAAPSNITLATTVAASPSPTTTGFTVASSTGLAVGQAIRVTIAAGASAGTYVRWISAKATDALTIAPALPAAPATADVVVGCVTWALGTNPLKSMDIAHYNAWKNRELLGCVLDKFSVMLDSNAEPQFSLSGPAQGFAGVMGTFSAQAEPGAFTTVGADSLVPSGMTAVLNIGSSIYQFTKMQFDLENGLDVQNNAAGTDKAVAFFRKSKRKVTGKLSAQISDDLTAYTPSQNGIDTNSAMLLQQGQANGAIWAIYCPKVQIMAIPDTGDDDETGEWNFDLCMLGSSTGNDEIYIAAA